MLCSIRLCKRRKPFYPPQSALHVSYAQVRTIKSRTFVYSSVVYASPRDKNFNNDGPYIYTQRNSPACGISTLNKFSNPFATVSMQYSLSRNQINIREQGNAVRGKQIREISCGNVTSPTLIYMIAFNDPFIDALTSLLCFEQIYWCS